MWSPAKNGTVHFAISNPPEKRGDHGKKPSFEGDLCPAGGHLSAEKKRTEINDVVM